MRVLVCGSRTLRDAATDAAIRARLEQLPTGSEVLHGDAYGPDRFAGAAARDLGLTERVFAADWVTFGNRAGIVRNLQMLDEQPTLVIAAWDGWSRGTRHTISEAERRGIPVELIGRLEDEVRDQVIA